jgi:hypothetical protein
MEGNKEVVTGNAYIFLYDSAKAAEPENARAGDLVDEHALAAEHGLAEALALVLLGDALGGGEEGVFADAPDLGAVEAQERDVAQRGGREQDLAGPRVVGHGHVAAGEELFHGEFDRAFEGDGWGHGDHDALGDEAERLAVASGAV